MPDDRTFQLRYFAPDPDLAELVSSLYSLRIAVTELDEAERADRPQFRFMLSGAGRYGFPGGHEQAAGKATIIGPTTGPVRSRATGPLFIVGFGIMPAGWAALMGPDSSQLTDRCLDAVERLGPWLNSVYDQLVAAQDDDMRIALLQDLARSLMQSAAAGPVWFTRTVDEWLAHSLSPHIDDLVAATGMSIRSVERMTKRFYGVPPKLLARKYRALRAAAALARGEKLNDSALADAFYDQSHLIRELKQFAGATPGQLAHPSPLTEATTQGRKGLEGKVGPLVSDT